MRAISKEMNVVAKKSYIINELLKQILQQDYVFAAIVEAETDEFALYDFQTGKLGGSMTDFWNTVLTKVNLKCSEDTLSEIKAVLKKEHMLQKLEAAQEFSHTYDCCLNSQLCRMEIKIRFMDEDQNVLLVTARNITDQRMMACRCYEKEHDLLTGLLNRSAVFETCRRFLTEYPERDFMIVHCDIRSFHLYNTFLGEAAGDRLLCKVAELMCSMGKAYDLWGCGRIEADVFCMVLPDDQKLFEKKISDFYRSMSHLKTQFPVKPNIGIYRIKDRTMPVDAMFTRATIAAKNHRNQMTDVAAFYDDGMEQRFVAAQQIQSEMYTAIVENQFEVYLQPKYELQSGKLIGAEALVRWTHPKKGMILPGAFIPAFEENGFITELDRYMWEHVCMILKQWKTAGIPLLPISVNLSRVSMNRSFTVVFLENLVEKYQLDPKYLELEFTESACMDEDVLKQVLKELQAFGFRILMDDFGSGYSSLNTLKELPVDVLKLDMKFLSTTQNHQRGDVVLSSIVQMGKRLNLPMIAEGVEKEKQADYLRRIGCEFVQGFYFAKPMPVSEFEKIMAADQKKVKYG